MTMNDNDNENIYLTINKQIVAKYHIIQVSNWSGDYNCAPFGTTEHVPILVRQRMCPFGMTEHVPLLV